MKRGKLIIGIAIALIVFLSACGGEKQTEEENPDVLTTLSDTDFYVIDVWNGFCEMSSYYHSGLSVTGEEMDAAFTLSELKKEVCENGPKFDEAVRNLPDRYSDTVEYWDYFYSEAQRLLVLAFQRNRKSGSVCYTGGAVFLELTAFRADSCARCEGR